MHVRLFKPTGPDRVAYVADALASGGGFLVQVAKGPSSRKLREPKLLGPMTRELADQVIASEVATLLGEGFVRSGLGELLIALESKKRRKRALAARRLGWLKERAAVPALLALAAKANEELPVVVDALGEIGDPVATDVARAAAERKLLSRRRSGAEALRKLGDLDGLAQARQRALERIPATVASLLAAAEGGASDAVAVASAISAVPTKDRGLVIDSLYELGTDVATNAARLALRHSEKTSFVEPHIWRYAKSVFKRSLLRHDPVTFGALAYAIETIEPGSGTTATVKSGLDGTMQSMRIFGPKTRRYMMRLSWRYLRSLGRYRPALYAAAAAEVLAHYTDEDAVAPQGLAGSYTDCHLLGRILYGGGNRMLFTDALRFRLKSPAQAKLPAGVREEAFAELWDRSPESYLTVLGGAKLLLIQTWAYSAVTERHPDAVRTAPLSVVLRWLDAPYPPTVELGVAELRVRFDPARPDWDLVTTVVRDERSVVRDLGIEWLAQTVPLWALSSERVATFLSAGDATVRAAVAGHVEAALAGATPAERMAMATAILALLRAPEATEGAHDTVAAIARSLVPELVTLLPATAVLALLDAPSAGARAAAAVILAAHPDADSVVGPEMLALLGSHPQVSLREAARIFIARRRDAYRASPAAILELLDSAWPDMRAFAIAFVERELEPQHLGLETVLAVLDSTYPEVQDLGKVLVERRFAELPTQELLAKLLEHPHPNMRRFVLDRLVTHLKEGFVALAATEEFFRTLFLSVTPDRSLKSKAIAFLERRGSQDAAQAEVALRLLGELVKSKTVFDFEAAVGAMTRIRFAFVDADITESSAPIEIDDPPESSP